MNTQREMFEAWWQENGPSCWSSDWYTNIQQDMLWSAWQAAIAAQEGNKLLWQPVSNLPEKFTEVMVWPHPSDWCMVAEYDGSKWCYAEYEPNWGVNHITCFPTHWMPLPQEPNK